MKQELIEKNLLLKLSIEFSLAVIAYCDLLDESRKFAISRQLTRSGTVIGANAMEAQNAESKADFIHKLKIAAKEADETQYWLLLCNEAESYPKHENLFSKLESLQKILNSILTTARRSNTVNVK
jgi:four helix bundle protein